MPGIRGLGWYEVAGWSKDCSWRCSKREFLQKEHVEAISIDEYSHDSRRDDFAVGAELALRLGQIGLIGCRRGTMQE